MVEFERRHFLTANLVGIPESWSACQELWKSVYGEGLLDTKFSVDDVPKTIQAICELMTGPKGQAIDAEIQRIMQSRPRCLNHGDARYMRLISRD